MSLRVAILHNHVPAAATPSDRDVLTQVASSEAASRELGHTTWTLACTLNLQAVVDALSADRPDVVFNLVESLAGCDRLAHLLPALLEGLEIPFTGSGSRALELSNCKPAAKLCLRSLGLPTPDWIAPGLSAWPVQAPLKPPYIVKAIWEHASLGIDDSSVVRAADASNIEQTIARFGQKLGTPCFAEAFVPGREFNLSLLAGASGVEVLPPAEIDFSAFPADKPRIVGYAAKWDEGTFEFDQTPRRFDFSPGDDELLERLRGLAHRAWQALDLRGYARVDFRVDESGQPFILEVNTNPCLSPDAGFAAALARAGISFPQAVERLLRDALPLPAPAEPVPARTKRGDNAGITLRTEPQTSDCAQVRRIVEATGLFRPAEIDVAEELVEERIERGLASGYHFLFAEEDGHVLGYACFGHDEMTVCSYELYWIAVEPAQQGRGIGRILLAAVEDAIRSAGGRQIYIETSNRADYLATRGFYLRCGYEMEAVLKDFYAPNDGKVIYVRPVGHASRA
jgi:D-alanine--D-alanine ligase